MSPNSKKLPKIFLALLIIVAVFFIAAPVFAQPPDLNLGLEYAKATGLVDTDIRIIVARIINVALGLLGVVALALVLYGGYEYMTAAGNEEQISKAKKILLNAAIGLAIILSAFAITRFVISKLTDAIVGNYCAEHPADCQPAPPPCGPGECPPLVQTLFYATSTPSGQLAIKNVTVSVLFFGNFGFPANYQTGTVPPAAPNNIKVVKKSDQSEAPGNFSLISASRIDFVPNGSCVDNDNPANSDSSNTCLEKNTPYQVILTTAIKSTGGLSLDCSTTRPCVGEFTTDELFDRMPPTISMILPGDGARVLVNTNIEISANYSDDAGVKLVTFNRDGSKIKDIVLNPFERQGTTSTLWFTGITAPATYALMGAAMDVDNHETTSMAQTVRVLPAYCFNGVQDVDETGIDCGPTCGACLGQSCQTNLDCAGTYCDPATKTCVARPLITGVSPMDGKEGNYISIFGRYFGAYSAVSSTVRFLGDEADPADDKTATPVTCFGSKSWRDNLIVVEVPAGAVSGPLQVGIDGLANLSNVLKQDKTNDDWGPNFPTSTLFIVNDTARPGLCDVNPSSAAPSAEVAVSGNQLGESQGSSVLKFGGSSATVGNWTNALLSYVEVPAALPSQNLIIQAIVGGKQSNPIPFKVLPPTIFTGPQIDYIEPISGPVGSYVTIYGQNFGESTGQVFFGETAALPPVNCPASWSPTQIVIKAPAGLEAGAVLVKVKTTLGESNSASFTVNSSSLRPGLCLIEPNNGPEGTAVILKGEGFGASGKVEYWEKVTSTFAGTWSDGTITDQAPTGAKTGQVKVWSDEKNLYSNPLNFKVQNCQEELKKPGAQLSQVCPGEGVKCCAAGSCLAVCPEEVGPKSSVYAWSFSTGQMPKVPRVVEACGENIVPSPSPLFKSPILDRPAENVCVNAQIQVRFSTLIKQSTVVLGSSFIVETCADATCDSAASVSGSLTFSLTDGDLASDYTNAALVPVYDTIRFLPTDGQPLNLNTWYRARLTTAIKSFAFNATTGSEDPLAEFPLASEYSFKFKTRNNTNPCQLSDAVVSPDPFTAREFNKTYYPEADKTLYNVTATADDNICWAIDASVYDWQWNAGTSAGDTSIYAEVTNDKQGSPSRGKPDQDLITKDKETLHGGEKVWAKTGSGALTVTDEATLYISPAKPRVINKWPDCLAACINADIGARFNMALDSGSLPNTAVTGCQIENADDPCLGLVEEVVDRLSLGTTDLEDDTLIIDPAGDLIPNKYYRVILKGGVSGVISSNYLEIDKTSLNYNCDAQGQNCRDYSWVFKTKDDAQGCAVERIEVQPALSVVYWIGDKAAYRSLPYGAKDDCQPASGQLLAPADYNWQWSSADTSVASVFASVSNNKTAATSTATAVGQGAVNAQKQQVTQISAATAGRTGQADFVLQCGYSPQNSNCPSHSPDPLRGVGQDSCCYPRPTVDLIQPSVTSNVCPNTAITLKFDQLMNVDSFSSSTLGYYNIILAEDTSAASCPAGQYQVATEEIKPVGLWQKAIAFVRHLFGRPARAQIYCYGGIDYSLESKTVTEAGTNKTEVSLVLKKALAGVKDYTVIVASPWVKSLVGVSLPDQKKMFFGTRENLCQIDKIEIDPVAWWFRTLKNETDDDPSLLESFDKKDDIDKVFTAHAYFKSNVAGAPEQELQPVEGVYSWTHTWSIDDDSIVKQGSAPYPTFYKATSTEIVAQGKNGVTQVGASAVIDASSVIDQGSQYSASSTVQVFICENPWPDAIFNPNHSEFGLGYVDAEGTDDLVLGDAALGIGRGWTNFKLMYCRDAGKPKYTSDDLPELRLPKVLYHQ